MRVLRAHDYVRMPWKNGGGVTTEIVVSPDGLGLDAFDWRVSMAEVASDGPFSIFPGVDRTLAVLDGEGVSLAIAGRALVTLKSNSEPLSFPADVEAYATLTGGPIHDLNVMTRRGRYSHRVASLTTSGQVACAEGTVVLLFCARGTAEVSQTERIDLRRHDAVIIRSTAWLDVSSTETRLYGVTLMRAGVIGAAAVTEPLRL
jgi:uncharacterized protein